MKVNLIKITGVPPFLTEDISEKLCQLLIDKEKVFKKDELAIIFDEASVYQYKYDQTSFLGLFELELDETFRKEKDNLDKIVASIKKLAGEFSVHLRVTFRFLKAEEELLDINPNYPLFLTDEYLTPGVNPNVYDFEEDDQEEECHCHEEGHECNCDHEHGNCQCKDKNKKAFVELSDVIGRLSIIQPRFFESSYLDDEIIVDYLLNHENDKAYNEVFKTIGKMVELYNELDKETKSRFDKVTSMDVIIRTYNDKLEVNKKLDELSKIINSTSRSFDNAKKEVCEGKSCSIKTKKKKK